MGLLLGHLDVSSYASSCNAHRSTSCAQYMKMTNVGHAYVLLMMSVHVQTIVFMFNRCDTKRSHVEWRGYS